MEKFIPVSDLTIDRTLARYEEKFKALADQKRLRIINLLSQHESTCVCDLTALMGLPQSKLSYHLKILLDANLILKETKGTWSHYTINEKELTALLSPQLCSILQPNSSCC